MLFHTQTLLHTYALTQQSLHEVLASTTVGLHIMLGTLLRTSRGHLVDSILCLGTSPWDNTNREQNLILYCMLRNPLADLQKSQVFISYCHFLITCCNTATIKIAYYACGPREIAILPQFLTIEPHFVRESRIS